MPDFSRFLQKGRDFYHDINHKIKEMSSLNGGRDMVRSSWIRVPLEDL
jgi:hypothetical protein